MALHATDEADVKVRRVAVAYSGGRDSTALLHATLAETAVLGVELFALHVHHGLSGHADAWQAHCEAQCARWSRAGRRVEFVALRVATRPARGESVEAWARRRRYEALRTMALDHRVSLVLLAQHRRDQAETLLLQALRGAGPKGLSGMARIVERDGVRWCRPWLDRPRAAIDAYVRRHRLKHVDDDSNDDRRFARNRLRLHVWPALVDSFADAEVALAMSAAWAQQASAAIDEWTTQDLHAVSSAQGLEVGAWLELSPARRSLVLRAWLQTQCGVPAPASLTVRLLDELPVCRSARWPVRAGELRLHRGRLRLEIGADASPAHEAARETHLKIDRLGRYPLPLWGGQLRVEKVSHGGVPLAWLARLELRVRAGAERFQHAHDRPPRSLKKQYQDAGVPAWERVGPLVHRGAQLVYVPGLGLDCRAVATPGPRRVSLRWEALAVEG